MFLIKLAFKNLTRHKRRTIITSSALAVGLIMFLLLDSLLVGMFEASNTNLKDSETAEGKVLTTGAFEDIKFLPFNNRVKDPDSIMEIIEELGGKASKRVVINADMIFTEEYFPLAGSTPILFTSVDLKTDNNAYNVFRNRYLVDGRFMEEGSDEVVMGSWLAEDIGAEVGDWFTISTRTAPDDDDPGYQQTIDVEIVGLVKVENPMINRRVVYYPLDMSDYYLDLYGSVTEVALRVPFGETLEEFQDRINPKLPKDLKYYTWKEVAADYVKLLEAETGGSAVILFLIVLIALVGITNTMLMTINERQRELGMMRALGMSGKDIRLAFLYEAAGIGIIGSVIGVLLGVLLNIPMVEYGIDYSSYMRNTDMGYKISAIMRGSWNIPSFFIAFFSGIIIPVLVGIIPTKKAILKSIPDCISSR
ncbi:MAG: FtsX-like permease family protein [Spirochaetaceae bacterium]